MEKGRYVGVIEDGGDQRRYRTLPPHRGQKYLLNPRVNDDS